jgi:hypothetical protein
MEIVWLQKSIEKLVLIEPESLIFKIANITPVTRCYKLLQKIAFGHNEIFSLVWY